MILETSRLILRPYRDSDLDAIDAYASAPDNLRYLPWGPNDAAATLVFIRESMEKWQAAPPPEYSWALEFKEAGRVIGGCGLRLNPERDQAELGWVLHRDYWRKGLMAEAVAAAMAFGFGSLGLHRLWAKCDTDNYGSWRVMEKCGMRREAHFRRNRFDRKADPPAWADEYFYAILADEWRFRHEE